MYGTLVAPVWHYVKYCLEDFALLCMPCQMIDLLYCWNSVCNRLSRQQPNSLAVPYTHVLWLLAVSYPSLALGVHFAPASPVPLFP